MRKNSIKISVATLTLIEPQIIKVKVNEGAVFDVKETFEAREANLKLSEGKPFCILLDGRDFFISTPESRQLSASGEFSKERIAIAMVTKSLAMKILGNFFIKFHNPASPTRLFTNEDEALRWLQSLLKIKKLKKKSSQMQLMSY